VAYKVSSRKRWVWSKSTHSLTIKYNIPHIVSTSMNNEKKKRNQTNLIAEEEKHEHNGIKNHNNIQNHLEPKLNFNHNQN